MALSFEEKGIYGFAEEWFTTHGYSWKVKKVKANRTLYALCKDGIDFNYEIPIYVTKPKDYMKFVDDYFEMLRRYKGEKT